LYFILKVIRTHICPFFPSHTFPGTGQSI